MSFMWELIIVIIIHSPTTKVLTQSVFNNTYLIMFFLKEQLVDKDITRLLLYAELCGCYIINIYNLCYHIIFIFLLHKQTLPLSWHTNTVTVSNIIMQLYSIWKHIWTHAPLAITLPSLSNYIYTKYTINDCTIEYIKYT